ncbi:MAG: aminoglycoside 6-adenylyltransferase [Armatimonas sp.]
MHNLPTEAEVLTKLIVWAEAKPEIRAMLLTSSRARPGGSVDVFSDYDIVLAVTNGFPTGWDSTWLYEYGEPMVRWGDEDEERGVPTVFRSVIYQDRVKIDYTLWPLELLQRITDSPALPEELDAGYRVLLDKDGATATWAESTAQAFLPSPPTQAEYTALVEEFWWVTTYIAKSLRRGEVVFARWVLTGDLRDGALRRMLEWHFEPAFQWTVRPGVHGRGLEELLPSDTWAELAATYETNDWFALWRTVELFRRVAKDVAQVQNLVYPQTVDDQVSTFLKDMEELRGSTTIRR